MTRREKKRGERTLVAHPWTETRVSDASDYLFVYLYAISVEVKRYLQYKCT